jgi:hypothetical protein
MKAYRNMDLETYSRSKLSGYAALAEIVATIGETAARGS